MTDRQQMKDGSDQQANLRETRQKPAKIQRKATIGQKYDKKPQSATPSINQP